MEDVPYIALPPQLPAILRVTAQLQFSMASEPLVGALLRMLAASKPGGQLLELGTGTGMATAWILEGMDSKSSLISVDNDSVVQQLARECLGEDDRLTLVTSDAVDFLNDQAPHSFDFVFADAMPGKYEALDRALGVVKPGGFYVIDDMLPLPNWPEGHAERIPILMEELAHNPDFVLLPLVWASGAVVAVRR